MTVDQLTFDETLRTIVWGRHPAYANGRWIKLAHSEDMSEIRFRRRMGFELRVSPRRETR